MTKQPANASSGLALQGDGAPEILLTSAAIEAGVSVIRAYEYDFWESRSPNEKAALVTAIYAAMCVKVSEH